MKLGIIGAGWIADKMAETLTGLDNSMKYAIAARALRNLPATGVLRKPTDHIRKW